MRPPKVAFIAPREVSRTVAVFFPSIRIPGHSASFTRSDEGYFWRARQNSFSVGRRFHTLLGKEDHGWFSLRKAGVHVDRTPGGDRDHRYSHRLVAARGAAGP